MENIQWWQTGNDGGTSCNKGLQPDSNWGHCGYTVRTLNPTRIIHIYETVFNTLKTKKEFWTFPKSQCYKNKSLPISNQQLYSWFQLETRIADKASLYHLCSWCDESRYHKIVSDIMRPTHLSRTWQDSERSDSSSRCNKSEPAAFRQTC